MAVSSRWRAAATVATMALFGWVTACGGDRVIEPPANQAPRALGTIPTQTVHVGDTATLDVADYFTDSDGDTLSYAATTSDPETATATANGSEVTLAAVAQGSTTVTVTATDPGGLSATQTFEVTVPNRAPFAVDSIARLELLEGDTATLDVADYFSDPDGDSLSYTVATSDPETATAAVAGSVVTLTAVTRGSATITATATDFGGLSAHQRFAITVELPPLLVTFSTETATAPEGDTATLKVLLSRPSETPLTVSYALGIDDDPATDDADEADYAGDSRGTVEFAPGITSSALQLVINDDSDIEPPRETLTATLDSPGAEDEYLLGPTASALVTIEEGVCDRTPGVRDEIMNYRGISNCALVDAHHLASMIVMQLCFEPNSFCTLEHPLTVLRSGDFRGLTGLRYLRIRDNALPTLPARVFTGLSNLEILHLHENQLKEIPPGAFSGLSRLSRLSLSHNQITSLPHDVFAGLSQLENLKLNGNRLSELPPEVFSGLSALSELNLSYNELASLPPNPFADLVRLRVLRLNRNQLTDLPQGAFAGLSALQALNLNTNPGSPFMLNLQIRRTDNEDLLAPNPGTLSMWIEEGAPFDMRVPLLAEGGTLSADTLVIEGGSRRGEEVTVTRNPTSQVGTQVSATPPEIPESLTGIGLSKPDPLVLFPPTGQLVTLSSRLEGAPEGSNAGLDVVLNPPPTSPLTLIYELGVDDDPATEDADESDFVGPLRGTLHVPAGTKRATLGIVTHDDDQIEAPREFIAVALSEPDSATGYVLGFPRSATVIIEEGVCDRTPQVRDELVRQTAASGCADVRLRDLEAITSLVLRSSARQAYPVAIDEAYALAHQQLGLETEWIPCVNSSWFLTFKTQGDPLPVPVECQPRKMEHYIDRGPITALKSRDFLGLSGVIQLELGFNQIEELPTGILAGLSSLVTLDIGANKLRSFPWHDLVNTPHLSSLILNHNQLRDFPSGLSEHVPNLVALGLQKNQLAELSTGALDGFSRLETLWLGFNPLTSLPPNVFSDLPDLTFLDLQLIRTTELPPDILTPLSSLESIWLTFSPLRTMPTLSGLSNLRAARLFGHSALNEFPPDVFSGLSSLEVLNLSANPRVELRPDLFRDLDELRLLNLASLGTNELPIGLFQGLATLELLVLRRSELSKLRGDDFDGLSRLTRLYLDGTRLEELEPEVFAGLGSLEYLWLQEGQLTDLPDGLFEGLTNLKQLLLHDNPGSPFILSLKAVRTDSDDLLAPGPATVEFRLAEGTPFNIRIPLSVHGGDISASVAGLRAGAGVSSEITVTPAVGSQAGTQLVAGPPPPMPEDVTGVAVLFPDPLILFAEATNRAPVPVVEIPWVRLRSSDHPASISPSPHFRDPDGDELEFTAVSGNPDIASVAVSGGRVVVMPLAGGTGTVAVSATDPSGLSADLSFSVVVRGNYPPGSFDINLILIDDVPEYVATAFADAVAYWEALLGRTELPDVAVGTGFELGCGGIVTDERVETIDELVIVASAREIDGPGGTLAAAGVCAVRAESGLPFMGIMSFDIADLARLDETGDMEEVILHEIGHTLGIGTLWSRFGLLINPSLPDNQGADTHFPGVLAVAAFDDAGGTEYTDGKKVPVENLAGPGSGDSHWREAVLDHELMTPYQDLGILDGLSAITIQSLTDLGYTPDVTLAEPFTLPGTLAADQPDTARRIAYGDDILKGPIVVVDRNGRVVRIIPD